MHPLQQRYTDAYRDSSAVPYSPDHGFLRFVREQLKKYGDPRPGIVLGGGRGEFAHEIGADVADWVEGLGANVCCDLAQYWPSSMNSYRYFVDHHMAHCLVGSSRANFWKNFHGRKGLLIGESAIWDKRVFLPEGYERLDDGTIQSPEGHKERTLLTSHELEQELLFTLGEIDFFYVRQDRRLILNKDFAGHPIDWCPPVVQYVVKLGYSF